MGGGFMAPALNRALPLAALHFVGRGPLPVDELLHGLEREIGRHGQILDLAFEALGAGAVGEGVELLALGPLGLVQAHPALDRLRHPFGREPRFEPLAVDDLAALVVAADVRDVGGHLASADFQRGAVEADVGDVVLAAAVRAAAHFDVDLTGQLVVDPHRVDPLFDGPVEAHRGGDPEFAAVGAGAGDDVGDLPRARVAEAEFAQLLPDVVDRLVADPAQDQVLLHGRAGVAAAVVAHDLPETAE